MSYETIFHLILLYRYPILILLAFIEGPLVSLSAGLIASQGYLNPFAALGILIGKDITVDAICYAVGRFGNRNDLITRYSSKIAITKEHWDAVDRLWYEHPWRTMFISKIAYGLSLLFLVSAGISRIPYRKFWFYAIQISLIQYGGLLLVGYYFGNSITIIASAVNFTQIAVAILTVLAVIYYLFSLYMRKRLLNQEKKEEQKK